MSYVIDRRLNGKNKSTVNRQRFLRRYREHIKKAVEEAVSRRSITDMEHGEQISIPGRDIDEPVLHHGRGGRQTVVHPGNKEFTAGEHIARPSGGGGGRGGGKASNSGERHGRLRLPDHPGGIPRLHVRGPGAAQPGQAPHHRHRHLQDRPRRHQQRRQPVAHQHRPHPALGPCAAHRAVRRQPGQAARGAEGTGADQARRAGQPRRYPGTRAGNRQAPARASTGCRSSIPSISSTTCWSSSPTPPPRR